MMHIRRMMALLMCLFLLPAAAVGESMRLPLQEAHQVTLTQLGEQQKNGSEVYRWNIVTAQENVTRELNDLAKAYAAELAPTLQKPAKDNESRLDVNILHSRTGLTWLSFMVQSRYVLNKEVKDVRFTTRTYDMATGERLLLTDIFPADSEAWGLMQEAVRTRINTYYPDLAPDADALASACTREAVEGMDFTLHGMSLVLHLHAADFYPGKEQLIEVPLYYPEIRPYMKEKAQAETDNLRYYDTVALTYDDGPNGWVTREMLNTLMENGVRATFFVVGDRVRGHARYVLREHDEGHSVATHNYNHVYANETTAEKLLKLKERAEKVHLEVLGLVPEYARAPGGVWKPMARAGVGWPLIQWSSQGSDMGTEQRTPVEISSMVVSTAKNGEIILMHDMRSQSVEASELFLPRMQERGYLFLTIDELFAKDGVELQPDTAYWRCLDGDTSDD